MKLYVSVCKEGSLISTTKFSVIGHPWSRRTRSGEKMLVLGTWNNVDVVLVME